MLRRWRALCNVVSQLIVWLLMHTERGQAIKRCLYRNWYVWKWSHLIDSTYKRYWECWDMYTCANQGWQALSLLHFVGWHRPIWRTNYSLYDSAFLWLKTITEEDESIAVSNITTAAAGLQLKPLSPLEGLREYQNMFYKFWLFANVQTHQTLRKKYSRVWTYSIIIYFILASGHMI